MHLMFNIAINVAMVELVFMIIVNEINVVYLEIVHIPGQQ